MEEEDFTARRDRLLAEHNLPLKDFLKLTEILTSFSEATPLLIGQSTYDVLVGRGFFIVDPRLEKYVRVYSDIPLQAKDLLSFSDWYTPPVAERPRLAANRGPWPPLHPRSPRKRR